MNAREILNKPLYELKRSIKIGKLRPCWLTSRSSGQFLLIGRNGLAPDEGFEVNILRFE